TRAERGRRGRETRAGQGRTGSRTNPSHPAARWLPGSRITSLLRRTTEELTPMLSNRRIALTIALALAALGSARAETCLSPFVKRLERPEKYLYLFCVDADARDNDFVAVIDVDPDSATYATITYTLDLGSKGNETHHW